jgi:hypothetical protein
MGNPFVTRNVTGSELEMMIRNDWRSEEWRSGGVEEWRSEE